MYLTTQTTIILVAAGALAVAGAIIFISSPQLLGSQKIQSVTISPPLPNVGDTVTVNAIVQKNVEDIVKIDYLSFQRTSSSGINQPQPMKNESNNNFSYDFPINTNKFVWFKILISNQNASSILESDEYSFFANATTGQSNTQIINL